MDHLCNFLPSVFGFTCTLCGQHSETGEETTSKPKLSREQIRQLIEENRRLLTARAAEGKVGKKNCNCSK